MHSPGDPDSFAEADDMVEELEMMDVQGGGPLDSDGLVRCIDGFFPLADRIRVVGQWRRR